MVALCFNFVSCDTKIGDCKVYNKSNEVFVDGFNYTIGISGINKSNLNISFYELDKYLYDFCNSTSYSSVYVTLIAIVGEDKYGNKKHQNITIGVIDTEESAKYTDFSHWQRKYSTKKMFYKDKSEYDKTQRDNFNNLQRGGFSITERYMPHSIK